MTRSPAHRLIALWAWIVLLLNGSVDAFGVHPCPHHDAVAHAPQPAGAVENGHGSAHGHGAAHHASAPDEQGGHDAHASGCTCLGSCLLGAAAPLPAPAVLAAAPIVTSHATPIARDAALLPGWLPYRLPYATAPPVRLA